MFTHSDSVVLKGVTLFLFLLTLNTLRLSAQPYPIQVTVVVTPPYSTKISDYTTNPGKILVNVRNVSPTGSQASVYFSGRITGESGIMVASEEGYKPNQPTIIPSGGSVNLTLDNISSIFDEDNLVYEGISAEDIIYGNGLPEDYYTICVRAFDYSTGEPLSGDDPSGCCSPFPVRDLEPPMITQPVCGDEVKGMLPQNLIISWTYPAGAPINTRYQVTMVEVQPSDHSPEDAFLTARRPVFFRSPIPITGTSYIYGPAQPALVYGKTYAFRVTAVDPSGKARFRNEGHSEICSFRWNKNTYVIEDDSLELPDPNPNNNSVTINGFTFDPPPMMLPTKISGKLVYKYAGNGENKTYPVANVNIRLVVHYYSDNSVPPNIGNLKPAEGTLLAPAKTDGEGNYTFDFATNIKTGFIGKVGDDEWQSKLYRCASIIIDGPLKDFVANPDLRIFFNPGQVKNESKAEALVRSANLKVTVKTGDGGRDDMMYLQNDRTTLSGVRVYLCRKYVMTIPSNIAPQVVFPWEDGKQDDNNIKSIKGMEVVAYAETNKSGVAEFSRVVISPNPKYTYFLYADVAENSEFNYTLESPVAFLPDQSAILYSSKTLFNNIFTFYGFNEIYTWSSAWPDLVFGKDLVMNPELPAVAGRVVDQKQPNIGIPNARVVLNERYQSNCNNYWLTAWLSDYMDQDYYNTSTTLAGICKWYQSFDYTHQRGIDADSAGYFSFPHLPIMFSHTDQVVSGPVRNLIALKSGYRRSDPYIINGNQPLSFGEKAGNLSIQLDRGAIIKGQVIDAETNTGVLASVLLEGDVKKQQTDINGNFSNYRALMLPQKQKLYIGAQGYLDTTLSVLINSSDVDLGKIKIYRKKRRLSVLVAEYQGAYNTGTDIRIKNARVQILNVAGLEAKVTGDDGTARFIFEHAENNNNQAYEVRVTMTADATKNYEERTYTLKIPYSQHYTKLYVKLSPATCVTGIVYAGTTPVEGAQVKLDYITGSLSGVTVTHLLATTDKSGRYTLKNIPIRNYKQTFYALKSSSNLVGDSAMMLMPTAKDNCYVKDYNLTVYNDMDITSLMGLPIAVTQLTPTTGGAKISGEFTELPANDQFAAAGPLHLTFTNIEIKPGKVLNAAKIPVAEPAVLPLLTNQKEAAITVFGKYAARLRGIKSNIAIEKSVSGGYGYINGYVVLDKKGFAETGYMLPSDIYLALNGGTETARMNIPVFNANKMIKKPAAITTGFYVCDAIGKAIKYELSGFQSQTVAKSSLLKPEGLLLPTSVVAELTNVTPSQKTVNVGDVLIATTGRPMLTGKPETTFTIDKWTLNCFEGKLVSDGIVFNRSELNSSMSATVNNLKLTSTALISNEASVSFKDAKILAFQPITVTGKNTGINYVDYKGKLQWSIYAGAHNPSEPAANLPALKGFAQSTPLLIKSVILYSVENTLHLPLFFKTYRFHNIADFTPDAGREIEILEYATPKYFKLRGGVTNAIPGNSDFAASLVYENTGKQSLNNVSPITVQKGIFVKLYVSDISEGKMVANGEAWETGNLLPVKVTLNHNKDLSLITINKGERIKITNDGSKYFDNVIGEMRADKNIAWDNFWFEGNLIGMGNIEPTPENKVKFTVEGAITAEDESIKVSGLSDAFPNMSIVYDFKNSRLTGNFDAPVTLGPLHGQAHANLLFDGNGWYFEMGGDLVVPILPAIGIGGEFYSLLGNYTSVPPQLSGKFGPWTCLPSGFDKHITGFLIQAGAKAEVLSGLNIPLVLLNVSAGVEVGSSQRMWMTFNDVNTYGVGLLMYGKAYVNGYSDLTCTSVHAGMNLNFGISGQYVSNGTFSMNGCASADFTLTSSQCLGVGGLCSDECLSVDAGSASVGLNVNYNSATGIDFGITSQSCNSKCP